MNGEAGIKAADKRLERKLSLAQERDTRVIIAKDNDTHTILNITMGLSRGVRTLRESLGKNIKDAQKGQEGFLLLLKHRQGLEQLNLITAEIHKFLSDNGVSLPPYRPPRGMELPASGGDGQGDNPAEPAEAATEGGKKKKAVDKN